MDKDTLISYMGWLNVATGVCAFLVALGVAGEFLTHILHARWEKQLDAIQDREKEELRQSAAAANERAAQLEHKTEQLRKENLELEEYISPRHRGDQSPAIEPLRHFRGMKAIVEYFPEMECKRTAAYIAGILGQAEWEFPPIRANNNEGDFLRDGVIVGINQLFPRPENSEQIIDAADVLVLALNRVKIKTMRFPGDDKLEKDVVRIRVGLKPTPDRKEDWNKEIERHELNYRLKKTKDRQEEETIKKRLHELSFPGVPYKGIPENKPPDTPPTTTNNSK